MKVSLTDKVLQKLSKEVPAQGYTITWDAKTRGLGFRVTNSGICAFVLLYHIHSRKRIYTLGRWPELTLTAARNECDALRGQIREGIDPAETRRQEREAETLNDLIDAYLGRPDPARSAKERYLDQPGDPEVQKLRPSTLRSYRGLAELHLRPALGSTRLKALTKSDLAKLHAKVGETAPYQANRLLALCSVMFEYAMAEERQWMTSNLVEGIKKYHEAPRERYLDEEEIARLHKALDDYLNEHAGTRYEAQAKDAVNALRLLLLTGSRLQEVLAAQWHEFDLQRGVWHRPAHRLKQKKESSIPLAEPAIELLRAMKPKHATGPLFVGRFGKGTRAGVTRPWQFATEKAGLDGLRLHDLRHSFAAHLASGGTSLQIIGRLLGHSQIATTQRYSHLLDAPLREATNAASKVLRFRKGA